MSSAEIECSVETARFSEAKALEFCVSFWHCETVFPDRKQTFAFETSSERLKFGINRISGCSCCTGFFKIFREIFWLFCELLRFLAFFDLLDFVARPRGTD